MLEPLAVLIRVQAYFTNPYRRDDPEFATLMADIDAAISQASAHNPSPLAASDPHAADPGKPGTRA